MKARALSRFSWDIRRAQRGVIATPRVENPGMSRHLDWEGCFNVRDLGGLATGDGRETRRGAVARADALDRLTARGWTALVEHGVRTVVDLRNDSEIGSDTAARPGVVTT